MQCNSSTRCWTITCADNRLSLNGPGSESSGGGSFAQRFAQKRGWATESLTQFRCWTVGNSPDWQPLNHVHRPMDPMPELPSQPALGIDELYLLQSHNHPSPHEPIFACDPESPFLAHFTARGRANCSFIYWPGPPFACRLARLQRRTRLRPLAILPADGFFGR